MEAQNLTLAQAQALDRTLTLVQTRTPTLEHILTPPPTPSEPLHGRGEQILQMALMRRHLLG